MKSTIRRCKNSHQKSAQRRSSDPALPSIRHDPVQNITEKLGSMNMEDEPVEIPLANLLPPLLLPPLYRQTQTARQIRQRNKRGPLNKEAARYLEKAMKKSEVGNRISISNPWQELEYCRYLRLPPYRTWAI